MRSELISSLDDAFVRRPRLWLILICICYIGVAVNFAVQTPPWQAPDEPAHYNYIAHIATQGTLPVLHKDDYNEAYRSFLVSNRFPPDEDISSLRYESYQPPLYYFLGAIVYRLGDGSLLSIRLFGIWLGVAIILLQYFTLEMVFPDKPLIVLGATAFVAFLPMHVAVTAAVTNDILAELLVIAQIMILLAWMRGQLHQAQVESKPDRQQRLLLLLGITLGLGLLTKIYAYAMVPLCTLAVVTLVWATDRSWSALLRGCRLSLYLLVPALLMGLPWWIRSVQLYGAWDFLGLQWHDQVVAGQPTTTEWLAKYGVVAYSERAFELTFRSFWGVFGWLGVFMDARIYTALLVATGVLFFGLLWGMIRLISGEPDTDVDMYQRWVLIIFAVLIGIVTASYIWYNTKFVQHQGRYFFWGLLPISTFVALGWREVMRPLQGAITGILAAILAIALAFTGTLSGNIDKWTILPIGLVAILLLLQPLLFVGVNGYTLRWLPARAQRFAATPIAARIGHALRFGIWVAPFLLLIVLNLLIPTLYIVPQLRLP